jgi:hypothetical protein
MVCGRLPKRVNTALGNSEGLLAATALWPVVAHLAVLIGAAS